MLLMSLLWRFSQLWIKLGGGGGGMPMHHVLVYALLFWTFAAAAFIYYVCTMLGVQCPKSENGF